MTDADLVRVTIDGNGDIIGKKKGGILEFLGIKYTHPFDRFGPSIVQTTWEGDIYATSSGPKCYGGPSEQNLDFLDLEASEDCLSLNIWTPAGGNDLPVLLYVHGGAFFFGTGSDPNLNGATLASEQNLIVVNINYRLTGFLKYLKNSF